MNHITQKSWYSVELPNPGYAYRGQRSPNTGFMDFKWEDKKSTSSFQEIFPQVKINFALGFANPSFNCLTISN